MSAISEFAQRQNQFNVRMDAAVQNILADIEVLNQTIDNLQNSPGTITPEDQVLLDDLETRSGVITDKLEALDAMTPPEVPGDNPPFPLGVPVGTEPVPSDPPIV